jgi:hypothetical protein
VDAGRAAGDWIADQANSARDRLAEKVDQVKQQVQQTYQNLAKVGSALRAAADRVPQWARTAGDWIVEHRAEIVGALVAMVVEAACLVAIGWTGVGVVACGIAAGVVGGLVTGGMQGHTGMDLLQDAAIGGLAGGVGAALPMMGAVAGRALSKAARPLTKTVAKRMGGTIAALRPTARGASRVTRELADHTDDAARVAGRADDAARTAGRADDAANDNYADVALAGERRSDDAADAARSCARHSFDPDTRVRMADGTTKKISEVRLDDEVLATDPATGKTTARPVRALHHHNDRDLVDVTVTDSSTGTSTVVHTTAHHPFWNATTRQWTDAADLKPGDKLRNPDGGSTQQVTAVEVRAGQALMDDLTVADVHTYYILAESTPILVHNCGGAHTGHSRDCICGRGDNGETIYPPKGGFVERDGKVLEIGTRVSRFGAPTGTYVSPAGTSFWKRALPWRKMFSEYHEYVVTKPMWVRNGKAAPWFGTKGGGTQYQLSRPIQEYVGERVLKEQTSSWGSWFGTVRW